MLLPEGIEIVPLIVGVEYSVNPELAGFSLHEVIKNNKTEHKAII